MYAYNANTGNRLVPVPWSLVLTSGGFRAGGAWHPIFTLNMDRQTFDRAPSFARGNWNQINRTEMRRQVYSFYGVEPGSSMGGSELP
jgi:hypothetical protein